MIRFLLIGWWVCMLIILRTMNARCFRSIYIIHEDSFECAFHVINPWSNQVTGLFVNKEETVYHTLSFHHVWDPQPTLVIRHHCRITSNVQKYLWPQFVVVSRTLKLQLPGCRFLYVDLGNSIRLLNRDCRTDLSSNPVRCEHFG